MVRICGLISGMFQEWGAPEMPLGLCTLAAREIHTASLLPNDDIGLHF